MILALSRQIPAACSKLKAGTWDRKTFMGTELNGKTIGIIGLGRIGLSVARWCNSLGMRVVGYDPLMAPDVIGTHNIVPSTLEELYSISDFITVHTPLTPETSGLLNDQTLARCKDGVRIINCARGGIVDEHALLRALKSGKVAGAALDAFSVEPPPKELNELLAHPNVVCTPHLGASTEEAQEKVARDIAQQFVNAVTKNEYVGVVNASHIGLAKNPLVRPYLSLAEKMGSVQAQILNGKLQQISVILGGKDVAREDTGNIILDSVLCGLLSELTEESVNLVNAQFFAAELGIKASMERRHDGGNYANAIELVFETDKETRRIVGTLFNNSEPRIVKMDAFQVDFRPEGHMLIFQNLDQPGVLAGVTGALAAGGVNIANFALGRTGVGQKAMSVVMIDSKLDAELIGTLKSIPNMLSVRVASLPEIVEDSIAPGKPSVRPKSANFGSGPCAKRPGYTLNALSDAPLGRSHRSAVGKTKLKTAITETKKILRVPDNYLVGIVPASDTGAVEMALWSMLGPRPVDVAYWESFGKDWWSDITSQLKIEGATKHESAYGEIPDLAKINAREHDVVFTWNGTTSGVRMPHANWIPDDRQGLTICDATSAAFAMDLPWKKLDVTTFSWQKVLGGEGAHGMIILSPRAVERLESFKPSRPLPKIFRMTKDGKVTRDLFEGVVINTPSMLCVEDYLDALSWAKKVGGQAGLEKRTRANMEVLEKFVQQNSWIHFLAKDPAIRSPTSVCLTLDLTPEKVKTMTSLLEKESVAFDIASYRSAPAGLRIWCGATVETSDLEALMPWIKWAYEQVSN
eukprot:TRINITY_DN10888_c0_g1_i1.p1 TRINITY_DN10888_c0_g1~~TRINITY_DN10888_c0_g1_i1.p1  ORF type:complete len:929 (+),score=215.53 TRINITY_DN10888_c0_g1_i1:372-2789(+)